MIIERTSKEVVFRLPSNTKLEDLQEIANLFAFKEISRKSKATQAVFRTAEIQTRGGLCVKYETLPLC